MKWPEYPEAGTPLFEWLRRLYSFVRTLEIKGDGKTCCIDRTSSGSVLHILPQSNSNSCFAGYVGPFRIGFGDDGTIEICHGGKPSDQNAGVANVNGDLLEVPKGVIDASAGYVLLKATDNENTVSFSWQISATLPKSENGSNVAYSAIGEVVSMDDNLVIIQYYNDVPCLLIGGECE